MDWGVHRNREGTTDCVVMMTAANRHQVQPMELWCVWVHGTAAHTYMPDADTAHSIANVAGHEACCFSHADGVEAPHTGSMPLGRQQVPGPITNTSRGRHIHMYIEG